MKQVKLSNTSDIRRFFRVLVEESVASAKSPLLVEADRGLDDILGDMGGSDDKGDQKAQPNKDTGDGQQSQQPKKGDDSKPAAKPDMQPGPSADQTEKDYGQHTMKKKLFTIEDLEQKDVSLESLLDKLNTIRAGKSFKDQTVAAELEEYYNGLSSTARMALYTFLKGLAQLSLGEVDGSAAVRPDAAPPGIQMSRTADSDVPSGDSSAPSTASSDSNDEHDDVADKAGTEQPKEQEVEDDEAPIKVGTTGGNAKVEALRRHIRNLIAEGR
jgi:hypothetical protein